MLRLLLLLVSTHYFTSCASNSPTLTHGPMLGRQSANSMGVWCRTSETAQVQIRYGLSSKELNQLSHSTRSILERDNTARVHLKNLTPRTRYYYQVLVNGATQGPISSFKTLPSTEVSKTTENPEGLFNFKFEFGCGNNISSPRVNGILMPTYATMLKENVHNEIDFAILNGDFVYEAGRDLTPQQWQEKNNISQLPKQLTLAPDQAGVWQNYKIYLDASEHLRQWHTKVPSYYSIDDHEILNDVYGSGSPGYVNREAVFRDPASQAWMDYLGWSNHSVDNKKIVISKASLQKDANILTDKTMDFSKIDPENSTTLHVHWGKDGGKAFAKNVPMDDPNSGVYEIVEVINKHQIKVRPPFKANSQSTYSIGKGLYSKMSISNCDIFMLDTRSYRELHDTKDPAKKGLSMLGARQKAWLLDGMKKSKAKFFFVVSSVNFMIPHIGSNAPGKGLVANKDDAWTVFLDEREELIQFWEKLDKPVFVLTGDLHNSFAIKVTDKIWEFASAPHNSNNHPLKFEGNRPINGPFQYGPRPCFIRWSTAILNDVEKTQRRTPIYCVVQVNNVFNNPKKIGDTRPVAFPIPQVIFKYHSGINGELLYSETVLAQ
jgi:alkaline phosphatase D